MDLRFTAPWSPWIIIGITIAALLLAVFSYQRTSRPISRRIKTLLVLLRSLTILTLIFALLAPVLTLSTKTKEPPQLTVLIDTSESMSIEDEIIPDQEGPRSRFEAAGHIIEKLLKEAGDKYQVEILGFSSSLTTFDPAKGSPQGKETRLYHSLKEVSNRPGRDGPTGILLLSDGLETDKIDETRPPRGLPPIYAVGFGGTRSVKDINLAGVEADELAYLGRELPVKVKLETSDYPGEEALLILKEGKREVLRKVIQLKEGMEEHTIKITPGQEGRFQYTVSVSEKPGEITAGNNYANFSLRVVKSGIRVLYYEGEPGWEYAFLKRFFDRTEDIEATCLLRNKEGGYYRQDDKKPLTFPAKRSDLFAYDLIILGGLEAGYLTKDQQEAVVEFVSEHGGGLLFLAGMSGLQPGTELAPLLPIMPGEVRQREPTRISLTLEGRNHPITRLDPEPEINGQLWEELPYLEGITETRSVKPGAIVLANSRPGNQAFAAIQRYGQGRVMAITANSTWRWDIGPFIDKDIKAEFPAGADGLKDQKQPNEVYIRFYRQAIRWLSTKADLKPIDVFTDRDVYQEGEKVGITAAVYDQDYRPIEGVTISGEISSQGQDTLKIGLTGGQGSRLGRYNSQVVPPAPGKYKVKITAEKQGQVLGEAETGFIVEEKGVEFLRLDQNRHLLSSLSNLTGGSYFGAEDRKKILTELSGLKGSTRVTTHQIELWDRWLTFFLFLVLIGTEWILRKKYGLI